MLSHYHAGVYGLVYKKRWSCCGLQRMAPGCSTTSIVNESKSIDAVWLLKSSHVHGYLFSYSARLLSVGPSLTGLVFVEWNFSSNHVCWVNSVLTNCDHARERDGNFKDICSTGTSYPWHTDRPVLYLWKAWGTSWGMKIGVKNLVLCSSPTLPNQHKSAYNALNTTY